MRINTTTFATDLLSARESTDDTETADAGVVTEDETEHIEEADAGREQALSKDTMFEILKNQRRRDALAFLEQEDGATTLSDMAEFIAARENDTTVAQLTSSQRKRVYIGLYQCHLPKMASAGIVDFDKNRGTIRLLEAAEQLDPFLVGETSAESSSSKHALGMALGIGLGTSAGIAGVPVFTAIPDAGWAIVSASALVVLAAVEALRNR
jgi:hypothetical protein